MIDDRRENHEPLAWVQTCKLLSADCRILPDIYQVDYSMPLYLPTGNSWSIPQQEREKGKLKHSLPGEGTDPFSTAVRVSVFLHFYFNSPQQTRHHSEIQLHRDYLDDNDNLTVQAAYKPGPLITGRTRKNSFKYKSDTSSEFMKMTCRAMLLFESESTWLM